MAYVMDSKLESAHAPEAEMDVVEPDGEGPTMSEPEPPKIRKYIAPVDWAAQVTSRTEQARVVLRARAEDESSAASGVGLNEMNPYLAFISAIPATADKSPEKASPAYEAFLLAASAAHAKADFCAFRWQRCCSCAARPAFGALQCRASR